MAQDELINYTTGQPNATPFVPGSQYVSPAPKSSKPSDEEYMKSRMDALVKSRAPKPPKELSYSLAHEARKKK